MCLCASNQWCIILCFQVCSNELATWWAHVDLMATSIKDPDALVAAAGKADLMSSQDAFSLLHGGGWIGDAQAKTHSLLQIVEGKVKGEPVIFHQFLAVLRKLPGLSQLASQVQANYGMCMLSAQFSVGNFTVPK